LGGNRHREQGANARLPRPRPRTRTLDAGQGSTAGVINDRTLVTTTQRILGNVRSQNDDVERLENG
jgi:hypothetical protein